MVLLVRGPKDSHQGILGQGHKTLFMAASYRQSRAVDIASPRPWMYCADR
jgi:hypothetical protein